MSLEQVLAEEQGIPTEASPTEFLTEPEKSALELIKQKITLTHLQAKEALTQNENSKLTYDNLVLKLTLKYNLKENDVITEDGQIVRKAQVNS